MVFNLCIIVIVLLLILWHGAKGLFSATLSAFLTIMSAALAFSFMEIVVNWIKPAHWADSADAIVFAGLFVLIYLALRQGFDRLIPGNVRLKAMVDRIGGGVMGLVAGIFTAGVVTVAAQMMPFGPSIAGYSRYALADQRDVTLHVQGSPDVSAAVNDAMEGSSFSTGKLQTPLLDVDDALIGTVGRFSAHSLYGQPLADVHPDYLQELFGQRLGLEAGAKHSAPNYPAQTPQVKISGLYRLASVEQRDGINPALRPPDSAPPDPIRKAEGDQLLLVVRASFAPAAADADALLRFSTGNCRLLCRNPDSGVCKDYYPLGTLEAGIRLYANHPDDPLFIDLHWGTRSADLVFLLDAAAEVVDTSSDTPKIRSGTLLEVKRMGFVDVSSDEHGNQAVLQGAPTFDKTVSVMRQTAVQPVPLLAELDPDSVAKAPLKVVQTQVDNRLLAALTVPKMPASGSITFRTNTSKIDGAVQDGKFTNLVAKVDMGDQAIVGSGGIDQVVVPSGKQMIQFECKASEAKPWDWADQLSRFKMVDDSGRTYPLAGAWCLVYREGQSQLFLARCNNPGTIAHESGLPFNIRLVYVIPKDASFAELRYDDKPIWAKGTAK